MASWSNAPPDRQMDRCRPQPAFDLSSLITHIYGTLPCEADALSLRHSTQKYTHVEVPSRPPSPLLAAPAHIRAGRCDGYGCSGLQLCGPVDFDEQIGALVQQRTASRTQTPQDLQQHSGTKSHLSERMCGQHLVGVSVHQLSFEPRGIHRWVKFCTQTPHKSMGRRSGQC